MAGVTLQLGRNALVDPLTVGVCVVAGLLLWRTRLNSAWYVGAGAAIGIVAELLG
jgi:chromate transporter